jgi:hypothetical protein
MEIPPGILAQFANSTSVRASYLEVETRAKERWHGASVVPQFAREPKPTFPPAHAQPPCKEFILVQVVFAKLLIQTIEPGIAIRIVLRVLEHIAQKLRSPITR